MVISNLPKPCLNLSSAVLGIDRATDLYVSPRVIKTAKKNLRKHTCICLQPRNILCSAEYEESKLLM